METLEALRLRCSLKAHISARKVESEKIAKVLDAARMAPSARNRQPWRFVVVQGEDVKPLAVNALTGPGSEAERSPVIIVICGKPEDDIIKEGKEYYLYDIASAVENMLIAATDLGLVTHLFATFDEREVKKTLGIPEDTRVILFTPLAYPQERSYGEAAAERLAARSRKNLNEFVYDGTWGNPWT